MKLTLLSLLLAACVGCTTTADNGMPDTANDRATDAGADTDANQAIASSVSGSDIWLGLLDRSDTWSISNLRNITTRQGYDNQPAFKSSGLGVYYVSIRDGVQADVHLYENLVTAGFRFTSTPQSEFSPMSLPGGKGISIVRVEADGKQSLWAYAGNRAVPLLSNVDNLGYYTWLDANAVAMFQVTDPPTLAIAEVPHGEVRKLDFVPGRSLHRVPSSGDLSFVDKTDADAAWISRFERATGKVTRIAPVLADSEDFCWTPDDELLMAKGKQIFLWRDQWEPVLDLDGSIPGDISRLTVGPGGKQIAFVVAEGSR